MIHRSSRTVRLAALVAATSLVVAACGRDDDETPEGADTAQDDTAQDDTAQDATTDTGTTADETGGEAGGGETIRLWLNGGDTPDELVDWAIAEFNELHPDVTVQFERQQWTGLVE